MIVFYALILVVNMGVFLNSWITLHYVLDKINKQSKRYRFFTYAFIVVNSYILFPMGISQGVLSFLLIVVTYFYVGGVFYGLHPKSPLIAFGMAFLLQGFGLYSRLLLKWEVYPTVNDLQLNIMIPYLFIVPAFIMLIYSLVPFFLKLETKNFHSLKKKL